MAITTAMIKELREATGAGILDSKKALEANEGNFEKAVEFLREKGLAQAAKKASREANEGLVSAKISDDGRRASLVEVNCETDFVARTDDFANLVETMTEQVLNSPPIESVEALLAATYARNAAQTVADAVQEAVSKLGENIVIRRLDQVTLAGEGVIESYIHSNNRVGVLVELATAGAVADQAGLRELAHDLTLHVAAANPTYIATEDVPADLVENERRLYMAQLIDDNKPDNIKARIVDGRLKKFYSEICLLEQAFVKDDKLSVQKLLQQTGKQLGAAITVRRFTRFEIGAN